MKIMSDRPLDCERSLVVVLILALVGSVGAQVECVNAKGWQITAEPSHADGQPQTDEDRHGSGNRHGGQRIEEILGK